jgi:hypothetical protein
MERNQAAPILVIAILHFVVGGLGLVCNLCGGASQLATGKSAFAPKGADPKQAQLQQEMTDSLEKNLPSYKVVQIATTAVSLAFGVTLIVAGIGLWLLAPWGRSLSIVYGITSVVHKVALDIYYMFFVVPAFQVAFAPAWTEAKTVEQRQVLDTFVTFFKWGLVGTPCCMMIYPFIVLIVMNMASVKLVFASAPAGEEPGSLDEGGGNEPPDQPFPPDDRFRPR